MSFQDIHEAGINFQIDAFKNFGNPDETGFRIQIGDHFNGWIDLRDPKDEYDNPAELFLKQWDEVEKWFFNELPKLVPEAKLEEKWVKEKEIEFRVKCPGCKRHTKFRGTAIFDLRIPKPVIKSGKCQGCGHEAKGEDLKT